ncbi:chemotaxis protein CheX [Jatrophihabitans sp. GAS493]|uniref:chemotaxis protein CheX n=1 Tax=Jatrophihabitans sp. GAS493 TaxID=1907575 RepID=UPI000BBF59AF|nr:chemotaxis protein CheX [Jatrophihabitans sp. GAS493]SOD74511.1 chemotaxis protein CheX [Jatrophihabitans sp. GAS493]
MTSLAEVPNKADLAELISAVWTSFMFEEILPIEDEAAAAKPTHNEVVASVSIMGGWSGQLILATTRACGTAVASTMFGSEDKVPDEELADAVGELANIVGGNVKSMLPSPSSLSLPQVVIDAHMLAVPSAQLRTVTVMAWGEHHIVASLWEAAPSNHLLGGL